MKHPAPDLGPSQRKVLTLLSEKDQPIEENLARAVDRLYQKGYVKFQVVNDVRWWSITQHGRDAI